MIYIGSLSKVLAPGLRVGYVVAAPALIEELRALRRLMLRHPSAFIQRAFALFLSLGHYDAQLRRLAVAHRERGAAVLAGLARYLPGCRSRARGRWRLLLGAAARGRRRGRTRPPGGATRGADRAGRRLLRMPTGRPAGFVRLGYQSIPVESIEPGLKVLGEVLDGMLRQR